MRVINFFDLSKYVLFFRMVLVFAIFQKDVIGMGIDIAFFEQPT